MTDLTLSLAILFFPGIICVLLIEWLIPNREWSSFRFTLYSLILGLTCYLLHATLLAFWERDWPLDVWILGALSSPKRALDAGAYYHIFLATVLSIPLAAAVSVARNRKWLHYIANNARVSNKFGDLDVWGFVFNSDATEWVVVRDIKYDLMYEGWVHAFSETADDNELLIRDVKVYRNTTAELLYSVDALYLSRERGDLTVEFTWSATATKGDQQNDQGPVTAAASQASS